MAVNILLALFMFIAFLALQCTASGLGTLPVNVVYWYVDVYSVPKYAY
jgi:hypothetical protein